MSTPYEIRTNDNGKSKKQSMAELKLRRLTELNQRLQEDLNRRRIPVSEAAMECVHYIEHLDDLLLLTVCPQFDRIHRQGAKGSHIPRPLELTELKLRCAFANFSLTSQDFMVPSRWGTIDKREDPYAPQQSNGCCSVM
jgi:guanine nucleotide-binding protein subunit gamma